MKPYIPELSEQRMVRRAPNQPIDFGPDGGYIFSCLQDVEASFGLEGFPGLAPEQIPARALIRQFIVWWRTLEPADAGQQVAHPDRLRQAARHLDQHGVAGGMAPAVVHRLEAVQIDDHHGESGPFHPRSLGHSGQMVQRVAAVVQAGQVVADRHAQPVADRGAQPVRAALAPHHRVKAQGQFARVAGGVDHIVHAHVEGAGVQRGMQRPPGTEPAFRRRVERQVRDLALGDREGPLPSAIAFMTPDRP